MAASISTPVRVDDGCRACKYHLTCLRFYGVLIAVLAGMVVSYSQVDVVWESGKAVAITMDVESADVEALSVVVKDNHIPIFGTWHQGLGRLSFRPVVPFSEDVAYQVLRDGALMSSFKVESDLRPLGHLTNIYPKCDTVPENLLKIHLHFSRPMGERYAEEFMYTTNTTGDTVEDLFLPLKPELWNRNRDRLTLWLNPGRIKRGLGPNLEMGAPLSAGEVYTIHVSSAWKDVRGKPLSSSFEKSYTASRSDRHKPDIGSWDIITPKSGTAESLQINFHEAIDHDLAEDCVVVLYDDQMLSGTSRYSGQGMSWYFVPGQVWEPGNYKIQIESRLEDLAGNNLNRLFDEEIDPDKVISDQMYYYLDIQIK